MTVETNGTVDAEDAIAYSARIFQDQLSMFVIFDDPQESIKEVLNTMSLYLGMEIPNWPPDNIAELSKKLEENNY